MKNRLTARPIVFLALIAILLTSVSCSKSSDSATPSPPKTGGSPAANEVSIQGSAFSPASLTVPINTTVKWTNMDSFSHTVTSNASFFDSGIIPGSGTYSFQFTTKGTYPYHCAIHALMTGTIIVQ